MVHVCGLFRPAWSFGVFFLGRLFSGPVTEVDEHCNVDPPLGRGGIPPNTRSKKDAWAFPTESGLIRTKEQKPGQHPSARTNSCAPRCAGDRSYPHGLLPWPWLWAFLPAANCVPRTRLA